uniref:Extended FMRFamide-12 n=1 Tax=Tyrannophasma gladiator TaxID=270861 RepID=FAR12_TYRGL|nr:RecName: Full=Extended FMRFamide-12; Short=FMRFa-12 [Tyrannophasma gladiator]
SPVPEDDRGDNFVRL